MIRRGRKSAAQTPAPKKEQVYGSSKNPVGSAASKTSASKIQLSESIVKTLENKRNDFNDNHSTKKVSLATLKAVMRRGMGAYSKSHRPTITGGAPNSRQAWGFARVNKFLKKYAGQKVKAAYVQDDDLMAKGGSLYHLGGDMYKHLAPNGKPSNLTHEQWHLVRTPEFKAWFGDWENDPANASKVVDENGEPLVVYRGMPKKRKVGNVFKYNVNLFGTKGIGGRQTNKFAFYFTDIKEVAEGYVNDISEEEGGYVVKSYFLNVRKLFKAFTKKNQYEITFKELYDLANTSGEPVYYKDYRGNIETDYKGNKLEVWNHSWEWKGKYNDKYYIQEPFVFFVDWNKDQGNQYFWRLYLENYLKYNGLVFYETTNNATRHSSEDDLKPKYGDEFSKTYAVFESNQIKLADGTNTTFDANNPDIRFQDGGLVDALTMGMTNLKKNGIVLTDNDGGITLIAYNTGNQERQPSLYNKALIYSSVQPIKSASEIIQNFDFQDFERFSESKIEDYKKTHLIIMNQNEVVYDSNVLAEGGDLGQEITCRRCLWTWNTSDSDEYDKYVCHKCGFDNRTFYDSDPIGTMKKKIYNTNFKYGGMNKIQLPDTESSYDNLQPILAKQGYMLNKIMKPTKSVEEIADEFDVTKAFVEKQLSIGEEHEMEHTYSKQVARDTALHHLAEDPEYYIRLKDMEMRTEAEKLDGFYKRGGAFSRETTCEVLDKDGERQIDEESIENLTECLNDLPQTKSMHFDYEKNDYTPARKRLHRDIIYGFKKDLVCVDRDEPIAILMGGSPASGKSTFLKKYAPYLLKEEIFKVDADEIRAKLPEYRGYNATQTHLETKDIVTTLLSDRNIGIPCRFDVIYDGTMNNTKSYIPLINLLKKEGYKVFIVYIDRVQKDVIVKRALERYKKSGRFVPIEVIDDFFEKGKTALQQLKEEVDGYMIVDGSNSDYKIIERGGEELPQDRNYSKIGQPIKITSRDVIRELKKGGEIDADDPQIKKAMTHKAGAAGGLLVGNRHSEGGIKAINNSTGQPLEMEGGEVVITRDAVSDDTKREFEGEMLSNREILSRINESGGGVSFAEGGDVPNKCACMGKQYKFGGKMMRDNEIVENIMTSHRKLFGIKYPELKPSEVMGKIFGNSLNYKSGGEIYGEGGTLVLINKKIPTFNAFSKLNKNFNPQAMKMAYKQYLNKKYFIKFEELPHMLQAALLMGNQKLVDSYINS